MRRTALLFLLPLSGALPGLSQSVPGYAIPNVKHYRESGVGNATGRSGSAHMTARALLGQDGNATIEVTTGSLDSGTTPPGSFGKVQFKPLDPNGNTLLSQNFTPLSTQSGYYSFTWPSLFRHQQAQIQGNITGIDNRTDVVTVVETVKLRPDLTIQKLSLPDSAVLNTPVNIAANVVELNGDLGATTTCQLAIDGTVVDQASNVYVDAGGSVSCAFTYTFPSTGSYTIQVTAGNVAPADWDTGNNSASGTILVVSPNLAQHGSASFWDEKGGFPVGKTITSEAWLNGSAIYNYSDTTGSTGEEQRTQTSFYSGGCAGNTNAVPYQFPVKVTYGESMDGTTVYSSADTEIAGQNATYPVNQSICGTHVVSYKRQLGSAFAADHMHYFISQEYDDSTGIPVSISQEVDSSRNAGDVTYFSTGYQCDWWSDCDNAANYYTWNNSTENVYGTVVPLGSTWVPSVTVTDAAGNSFGGSISVSLNSTQTTASQPNTCTNSGPDVNGVVYQNCSSSATNYTITSGSASN